MPLDRGLIDQQLQALGEGTRWWDQREMRDLPAVLHADEKLLAISRGKIARVRWLRRSWLIVATDRRLLCLRSGRRASWKQVEVSAHQIRRVALRVGPLRGRVVVSAGDGSYRLLVPRADAYRLATALTSLAQAERPALTTPGPVLMVRRVFDHVLALPAAALGPDSKPAAIQPVASAVDPAMEQRIDWLEAQVEELQRQVEFLENLLRERHGSTTPL